MSALADPGSAVESLAARAWSAPTTVLRNPAWQLSVVAEPGFLSKVPARSMTALVSSPAADAAFLAAAADACRAAPRMFDAAVLAIASRADIGAPVLARFSPAFGRSCTHDGLEVAMHRLRTGVDSLAGWDVAVAPTLIPSLRAKPSKAGPPALDAIAALMRHGLLTTRCPMMRAVVQLVPRVTRIRMLVDAPRDDLEFLRLAARAGVSGAEGRLPDRELWAEVLGAWHGLRAGAPFPPRMPAGGFAGGMHGSMQSNKATALARHWSSCANDGVFLHSFLGCAGRRLPAPEQAIAEACRAPRNSAAHLLALTVPRCPAELLELRSRSRRWGFRAAVACNPAAPPAVLHRLSDDPHWIVRGAARGAPTSGRDVLVRGRSCAARVAAGVLAAALGVAGLARPASADNLLRIPGGWVWEGGSAVEVANGWVGSGWASFPGVNPPWNPIAVPDSPLRHAPRASPVVHEARDRAADVPARVVVEVVHRSAPPPPAPVTIRVSARPGAGRLTAAQVREAIGIPEEAEYRRLVEEFIAARRAAAEEADRIWASRVPAAAPDPREASHAPHAEPVPEASHRGARPANPPGLGRRDWNERSAAGPSG